MDRLHTYIFHAPEAGDSKAARFLQLMAFISFSTAVILLPLESEVGILFCSIFGVLQIINCALTGRWPVQIRDRLWQSSFGILAVGYMLIILAEWLTPAGIRDVGEAAAMYAILIIILPAAALFIHAAIRLRIISLILLTALICWFVLALGQSLFFGAYRTGLSYNPITVGMIGCFGLFWLFVFGRLNRWSLWLYILPVLAGSGLVILTGSRTPMAVCLLILSFFLLQTVRHNPRQGLWLIAGLILAGTLVLLSEPAGVRVLIAKGPDLSALLRLDFANILPDVSTTTRLDMWSVVPGLFAQAPLTGHGIDSDTGLIASLLPEVRALTTLHPHYHNDFLNFLVKFGLVGAFVWVTVLLLPFRFVQDRGHLKICIGYTAIFVLLNLTDITFGYEMGISMFSVNWLLLLYLLQSDNRRSVPSGA